jgi:hypothetical protein
VSAAQLIPIPEPLGGQFRLFSGTTPGRPDQPATTANLTYLLKGPAAGRT